MFTLPQLMLLGELAQDVVDGRSDLGLDEAGLLLAARFVDLASGTRRRPADPAPRDRRRAVESALWIDETSAEPIDLDTVAGHAGLSPFHFLRSFKAQHHATPQQMLMALRLFEAKRRLAAGEAPAQVAAATGMSDQAHLTRAFARRYGVTPARYRRQLGG